MIKDYLPTVFPISVALCSYLVWISLPKRRFTNDEKRGVLAIESTDNDDTIVGVVVREEVEGTEEPGELILPKVGTPNYFRFAAKVAHEVKSKMGLPRATEANRIVALELVSKELMRRDVRKCDVHRFQAIAVDLVFMPTKYDVNAARLRNSRAYRERLQEMHPVQSWGDWLRGKMPFGRQPWALDGPGLSYSRG